MKSDEKMKWWLFIQDWSMFSLLWLLLRSYKWFEESLGFAQVTIVTILVQNPFWKRIKYTVWESNLTANNQACKIPNWICKNNPLVY